MYSGFCAPYPIIMSASFSDLTLLVWLEEGVLPFESP